MSDNKTFLCIIPARGGSKSIPNKNLVDINGRPLIYYSIKAVKDSNIFDKLMVNTDSKKIATIAKKYGAEVPFFRPKYLSTDKSLVQDVFVHALKFIEKKDKKYDYVCLVQPTTPLIIPNDFCNMVSILEKKNAKMVVSVTKTPCNINWVGRLSKKGSMENFSKRKIYDTLKEHFEETYLLNGAIYMGEWDIFYNRMNFYSNKTYAYIMPNERSVDIDSYFDLETVRYLMRKRYE